MSGLPFAAMRRGEVLLRLAIRQAQQQADHKEECEQQHGYYCHTFSSHMSCFLDDSIARLPRCVPADTCQIWQEVLEVVRRILTRNRSTNGPSKMGVDENPEALE